MRKLFIFFAVVAVCLSGPAASRKPMLTTHNILYNGGGVLISFVGKYTRWDENGDRVRIDGECLSACTLLLGIVRDVCATDRAQFGFHSASRLGSFTQEGTEFMWFFYSPRVRATLEKHGWASPSYHPDFLMISAREIVRSCD